MAPAQPPLFAEPPLAVALALAVVESSTTPLLLLDGDCIVVAASASFAKAFGLTVGGVVGSSIFAIGAGEWDLRRLRSLLDASASGAAAIPAYEIDLDLPGRGRRRLILNAHKLAYGGRVDDPAAIRLLLAIEDVTNARSAERARDNLLREKAVLMQEIQHRVANSLQIIASVLMQNARTVASGEAARHLRDAHSRVMAIAALQRQLAETEVGDVDLGGYLRQLCGSLGASMIDDEGRITLTVDVDTSRVSANSSVSLGLVVTELVINALKHAFPGELHGTITVGYASDDAGWRLTVADDGVGMPPDGHGKPGLGTSIVNALAKHLDAEVVVVATDPGTQAGLVHVVGAEAPAEALV